MFKSTLKNLRNACGLTQGQAAEKLGLAKSTISMYESGKREPDLQTLSALAELYHVDMNQLLEQFNPGNGRNGEAATDEQLKFALFNGDPHVTDEMFEEVKRYAEYIRQKYKRR